MSDQDEAQKKLQRLYDELNPFIPAIQGLRRDNLSPSGVATGGTGCFVDTGNRRFVLTARHVVNELRDPALRTILSGHAAPPVDISGWSVIDAAKDIDIATIEVPASFDPATINKRFYRPESWPPARARVGDLAVFLGFPGLHRAVSPRGLENRVTPFCDAVSSSSNRHFVMVDENVERVPVAFIEGLTPFGSTGGVSGSPVFLNTRDGKFILSGVIYEGGDGVEGMLFAAHADFVCSDGTIDRSLSK